MQMEKKFPGMLDGETPGEWAERAKAARKELLARVDRGIEYDTATSRFKLLDPQLVEGKHATVKVIEPFIPRGKSKSTGKSLREEKARWSLIAVLARDEPVITDKLTTDRAAREACLPVEVISRSITRWRCEHWDP